MWWTGLAAAFGGWLIETFIIGDKRKKEWKRRFYDYVDYWESTRESSESIGEDISELERKMDEDIGKFPQEEKGNE